MFTFEELPNELIDQIFSYLHSDQIIYSFFYLNIRFYNLCLPFIRRINLSTSTNLDLWNSENFQKIPSLIERLKLNDTQLDWVFDFPQGIQTYFPQLQTIQLRILLQNEHYKQYLPIMKQSLSSLVLDYQNATLFSRIDHEILHEFLLDEPSTKLNDLTIDGVCLSVDCESFQMCRTLKCLTISVEYQHHLFLLLEYLPQLEYFNIAVREGITTNSIKSLFSRKSFLKLQTQISIYNIRVVSYNIAISDIEIALCIVQQNNLWK